MIQFEWIVPLIVFFLWIINGLLRGSDEERRQASGRAPGRTEPGRPPRKQPTDIERFVEEVNRRRRENVERRPGTPIAAKPAPARPRLQQHPIQARPIPTVQPIRQRESERQKAAEVILVAEPAVPTVRPMPVIPVAEEQPQNLALLMNMLQTPEGLLSSVVLREVFGPPLCLRGRRG
jgi:hypothetical protein